MVFAETALIDNIQHSIDEWIHHKHSWTHEDSNKELTKDIGKDLKRYGYKKIPHLPLQEANEIQAKIMSALENGSEIIHYGFSHARSSSFNQPIVLTSGVSRDNLGIDYLCEIQRWDDEGDADDLETSLLFADDLLEKMGLDYKMKQVMANGIMNLVKTWSFGDDHTLEWWVKEPFSLFQPFNTLWPEWFVKEIESNTKV
jgi:hypothetical protein